MHITRFRSRKSPAGTPDEVDLEQFLCNPVPLGAKDDLPAFSLGTFKNDYRSVANFISSIGLGFDVDVGEPVPEEDLTAALQSLGIGGFYHSSSSSTAAKPKWHLFLLTERPIDAREYKELHAQVRKALPFKVGEAAKDCSRLWFVPAQGEMFRWGVVDGPPLKVSFLAPTAPATVQPFTALPDPSDEATEALVNHIVAIMPEKGTRQETHMALAGTLIRWGYSTEWTKLVIQAVTLATGNTEQKATERARMVDATVRKWQEASPISAWNKFCDLVGLVHASKIPALLGMEMSLAKTEVPVDFLPHTDTKHTYTYIPGEVAALADLKKANLSDVLSFLKEDYRMKHVLRWNTVQDCLWAVNPPFEMSAEQGRFLQSDGLACQAWFESLGIKVSLETCMLCMERVARQCPWNPVLDDLKRFAHDHPGDGGIETMCREALHLTDPLSVEMVRKQLIASCKRIIKPGTKVDTMLVFLSAQGWRKTAFLEALYGAQYVKTSLSDIHSKDACLELRGMLAMEFGELNSLNNSDVNAMKEFLSRGWDKYRPPYERTIVDIPRTCTFFGTTNDRYFLKDATGNRRFWVIDLKDAGKVDTDWVEKHRGSVWAEATRAAYAGEQHWFDEVSHNAAEDRAGEYLQVDALAEWVAAHVTGKSRVQMITVFQALKAQELVAGGFDAGIQTRLRKIFLFVGLTPRKMHNQTFWDVPDALKNRIPEDRPSEKRLEAGEVATFLQGRKVERNG